MIKKILCIIALFITTAWIPSYAIVVGYSYSNNSGGSWVTILDVSSSLASEYTDSGTRDYRLVIPANTSSYNGTKIRITFAASSTADASIDGLAFGASTSTDDFDSTPTRITFSGSNTATVPAGTTLTSDEVTFSFDKTKRYLISIYTMARNFKYYNPGGDYSINSTIDYSQTQTVSFNADSIWIGVSKVEIYVP